MLFLGADHKGFSLKEQLKKYLLEQHISFTDLSSLQLIKDDDYPDIAAKVAQQVGRDKKNQGILICGSGIGVCIVANKFKNIRAGLFWNPEIAKTATADDNVNIVCLPGDYLKIIDAQKIIITWLKTPFKKDSKYARRLKKIYKLERNF
jgi:ribose 5-phosphate isomerase B